MLILLFHNLLGNILLMIQHCFKMFKRTSRLQEDFYAHICNSCSFFHGNLPFMFALVKRFEALGYFFFIQSIPHI